MKPRKEKGWNIAAWMFIVCGGVAMFTVGCPNAFGQSGCVQVQLPVRSNIPATFVRDGLPPTNTVTEAVFAWYRPAGAYYPTESTTIVGTAETGETQSKTVQVNVGQNAPVQFAFAQPMPPPTVWYPPPSATPVISNPAPVITPVAPVVGKPWWFWWVVAAVVISWIVFSFWRWRCDKFLRESRDNEERVGKPKTGGTHSAKFE